MVSKSYVVNGCPDIFDDDDGKCVEGSAIKIHISEEEIRDKQMSRVNRYILDMVSVCTAKKNPENQNRKRPSLSCVAERIIKDPFARSYRGTRSSSDHKLTIRVFYIYRARALVFWIFSPFVAYYGQMHNAQSYSLKNHTFYSSARWTKPVSFSMLLWINFLSSLFLVFSLKYANLGGGVIVEHFSMACLRASLAPSRFPSAPSSQFPPIDSFFCVLS